MLGFEKRGKTEVAERVEIATCDVCQAVTTHMYFMQDSETKQKSRWYNCACGVTWNAGECKEPYDKAYYEKYKEGGKKLESSAKYPIQVYAPLMEEMMYGRKVLEVGHTNPYQAEAFAERGWIPYSIDKNTHFTNSERFIAGDFETHDFGEEKFNLIWIYHTVECFKDPKQTLIKCFNLLPEDGILFLATPDTDFIHTRSSSGFVHWKPQTNRLMWNRPSLVSYLEKLGFNIVMSRRNYEHRFPAVDDCHVVAQKKFF